MERSLRLRRAADFARLKSHGRRWRHPLALLIVVPNGLECSRWAFGASRRVGKATRRNRAKRLLRESVRGHLNRVEPGWDCLLVARSETAAASLAEVNEAVAELLMRSGISLPGGGEWAA
jgi:ribonuclease P protein component